MKWRLILLWLFGSLLFSTPAQVAERIDTSAIERQLKSIQNDENQSNAIRVLAESIATDLQKNDYRNAVYSMDRLARIVDNPDLSFAIRMSICDLAIRALSNPTLADRQFRSLSEERKDEAVEKWLNQSNLFKKEKNLSRKKAFILFLNSVGKWAERAGNEHSTEIQLLLAELMKEAGSGTTASVYRQAARTSQTAEDRNRALYEMARHHLEGKRFSDALAAVRQINANEWLEKRFETAIKICSQTPDSFAAIEELKREKLFCPKRELRSQFDVAIADIYLREERYEEAEEYLTAADAQYSYTDIMDDLQKRWKEEEKRRADLQKRIQERIKEIVIGDAK